MSPNKFISIATASLLVSQLAAGAAEILSAKAERSRPGYALVTVHYKSDYRDESDAVFMVASLVRGFNPCVRLAFNQINVRELTHKVSMECNVPTTGKNIGISIVLKRKTGVAVNLRTRVFLK